MLVITDILSVWSLTCIVTNLREVGNYSDRSELQMWNGSGWKPSAGRERQSDR